MKPQSNKSLAWRRLLFLSSPRHAGIPTGVELSKVGLICADQPCAGLNQSRLKFRAKQDKAGMVRLEYGEQNLVAAIFLSTLEQAKSYPSYIPALQWGIFNCERISLIISCAFVVCDGGKLRHHQESPLQSRREQRSTVQSRAPMVGTSR